MKKMILITLSISGLLLFSCSNEEPIENKYLSKEDKNSTTDSYYESEPFIAYNTVRGPMGFSGTGQGSYGDDNDRWKNFRDGGNCVIDNSVCIITNNPKDLNNPYKAIGPCDCPPLHLVEPEKYLELHELILEYLDTTLSDLKDNLDKKDLESFKNSMRFTEENVLVAWDMKLLEKGTKDNFVNVIKKLSFDLTGDNRMIILINPDTNKETIIN